MATTTIRLPEDLKKRVARAADTTGTTAHAFILEAIAEYVSDKERQTDFFLTAEERYAKLTDSGKTIAWPEMKQYLQARKTDKKAAKPRARKLDQ